MHSKLFVFAFQATNAIDNHWSANEGGKVKDKESFSEKLGLDPIKAKLTGKDVPLGVDMTTIEERITNLHTSLETALNSLKRMIHTAQSEHVPLGSLDLSESDLGRVLLTLPLPYVRQNAEIGAKWSTYGFCTCCGFDVINVDAARGRFCFQSSTFWSTKLSI